MDIRRVESRDGPRDTTSSRVPSDTRRTGTLRLGVLAAVVSRGRPLEALDRSAARHGHVASAVVASPAPFASSEFALIPIHPEAQQAPVWPAQSVAVFLADATATQAESVLGRLTIHSGQWGVGNAGVGPRMLRDEPWTDWVAAVPEIVDSGPLHVATWPGTGMCGALPTIYDNPSLVAITTPSALVPDWRLTGWWTDGSRVAPLSGSVRQVSPAGNRGISYLERTDRAPWPPGRYEFHVIAGETHGGVDGLHHPSRLRRNRAIVAVVFGATTAPSRRQRSRR